MRYIFFILLSTFLFAEPGHSINALKYQCTVYSLTKNNVETIYYKDHIPAIFIKDGDTMQLVHPKLNFIATFHTSDISYNKEPVDVYIDKYDKDNNTIAVYKNFELGIRVILKSAFIDFVDCKQIRVTY